MSGIFVESPKDFLSRVENMEEAIVDPRAGQPKINLQTAQFLVDGDIIYQKHGDREAQLNINVKNLISILTPELKRLEHEDSGKLNEVLFNFFSLSF